MKTRLQDHLEKLNGFLTVAETKSFRKASMQLRLSQPSLSYSIKTLEEALEVKLFNRFQKGVELTSAGRCLYEFATRLRSDVARLENKLHSSADPLSGQVRIGTYESFAHYFWPKVLPKLSKQVRQLSVTIKTGTAEELFRELDDRRIDLAMMTLHRKIDPRFKVHLGHHDSFGFFCSIKSEFENSITREQLQFVPTILVPRAGCGKNLTLDDLLRSSGIRLQNRYAFDNFSTALQYVLKNIGIGILPYEMATPYLAQKLLRPITVQGLPKTGFGRHPIGYVMRKDDASCPKIGAILQIVEADLGK